MATRLDALAGVLQPVQATAFTAWGSPVSWLEVIAFCLSVARVGFNIRVHPLAWPLAIVSSLMYWALFWNSRLYGDATLQLFFAAMGAWGWWQWVRGTQRDGRRLQVRALSPSGRWAALGALALGWPLVGLFLETWTDTDVPWWDAFPSAASVIGQWLLGRKYLDNWTAWTVVNVVSVALFAYKGLWLTSLLYGLFLGMSVAGWRAWRAQLHAPATA